MALFIARLIEMRLSTCLAMESATRLALRSGCLIYSTFVLTVLPV